MKQVAVIVLFCVSSIWALPLEESRGIAKAVPFREIGGRIISGIPATRGQFPWQTALYLAVPGGTSFCGGSIISNNWVLTAGHCAQGVSSITAYAAVISLSDTAGRVTLTASRVVVHSGYSSSSLSNDIAVFQSSQPVVYSQFLQPIALATSLHSAGTRLTVSGFGRTSDSISTISQTLNYVGLGAISRQDCINFYGNLHEGITCAVGNNIESTCNGDSGGPLLINYPDNPQEVGTVSFGSSAGCGRGYPTGYASVAYYRSWIQSNTGV